MILFGELQFFDSHEVGSRQFFPTCELRGSPSLKVWAPICFPSLHSFPSFLFSNIIFWNVADPLKLGDSFGQGF
jgi:hypothetical protein